MKRPVLAIALLALVAVVIGTADAHDVDPSARLEPATRFAHLTTRDGLANAHVEVIFQDSRGFMWFGTRGGLSRYDGYQFTTYRHDPANPNSPNGNFITDITEDAKGRLWVATNNGLSVFDPRLERFGPAPIHLDPNAGAFAVFEDGRHHLWVGTNEGRLYHLDPAMQSFAHYPLQTDSEHNSRSPIWDIIEDRAGNLWLAASNAVIKIDIHSGQHSRFVPPDGRGEVRVLYEDEAGHIWFNSTSLHKLDPVTKSITSYQSPQGPIPIVDMLADQNGQLWLATLPGLFRFDMQSGKFSGHFTHNPRDTDSLNSDRTFSLFEDKGGLIWIGTQNAGLNILDPRQGQFAHYRHDSDNPNSLGMARVTSISGDGSGRLWLGSDTILSFFDPASGEIDRYHPPMPGGPTPYGISTLIQNQDDKIWFSLGKGLCKFDPETGQFSTFELPNGGDDPVNPFTTLCRDETGLLWLGRQRKGASIFDTHTERFHPLPVGINSNGVPVIYCDQSGILWLTGRGALHRFAPRQNRFDSYPTPYSQANTILRDRRGMVWVGALNGLFRFDPANANFTHYKVQDGLPSSNVLAILSDQADHLWLSTHRGLARFDPKSETFHVYDIDDGLQGNEFISGSAWQAPGGRLYFGGENGLTAFHPDQIRDNTYHPPVVLSAIRLFNEPLPIAPDSPLTQGINFTDQLTLNHDQNVISFEFASLSYAAPHKNRYRYKLVGFEEDWNQVDSSRRFATYTSLPSGDYLFRVQGTNNSGLWSDDEVALSLSILPPWWETIYFRLAVLSILIGLLYAAFKWRVFAIEQYSRALEDQVAERTKELAAHTEKLTESEKRFRDMTELLPGGVVELDAEFMATYVNRSGNEISGYSQQDIEAGLNGIDLIHPEDREKAALRISGHLAGRDLPPMEYRILTKGGTVMPVLINAAPIRKDGEVTGFRASVTDITQIKETEQKLSSALETATRLQGEAELANRAKSAFLANMSHELRTPLNAILGYTQLMARDELATATQQEHLKTIARSGEHLLGLINNVLTMSKIEAGRTTLHENTFHLHRLLSDLMEMFQLRADDKGLYLLMEIAPEVPPYLFADEGKLRQILINLLSNAIKFTEKGGVSLHVKWHDRKAGTEETAPPGEATIRLGFEVEDTGAGVPAEALEALFTPFSQATNGEHSQEGTGLGLAISREFAHLMSGELNAESVVGLGTSFRLLIPVRPASAEGVEAREWQPQRRVIGIEPGQTAPGSEPYRLLIVEDDATNRNLLIDLLSPFGFDLRSAANGAESVEMWEAWQPHLVWMDMRLPVIDGYEATRRIKARAKATNRIAIVVALTASVFEEDREAIFNAGCDDLVRKPFHEHTIFDTLHKHLGIRFTYAEKPEAISGRREVIDKSPLTFDRLQALPEEWLTALQDAVEKNNPKAANAVIDQIRGKDASLAATLTDLIRRYRFDTLLALFRETE